MLVLHVLMDVVVRIKVDVELDAGDNLVVAKSEVVKIARNEHAMVVVNVPAVKLVPNEIYKDLVFLEIEITVDRVVVLTYKAID